MYTNNATLLKELVADVAAFEPEEIRSTDRLNDDLGLDSILLLDVLATLTRKHPELAGLSPTDFDINDETTYADLEELILDRIAPAKRTNTHDEIQKRGIERLPQITHFAQLRQSAGPVPYFRSHHGIANNRIVMDSVSYINYSSYNYLGTNGHPDIGEAVESAVRSYGTSVSASRLISGEIPLHSELEQELAAFLNTEEAIVLVGGHSTNVSLLGTLLSEDDLILHDSLAHNSIIQGAELSAARRKPFKHNDIKALRQELERARNRFNHVLIVAEGIYSMDGDICNLPGLVEAKQDYDCFLMIDEAHSLGTIGKGGRGVTSHFNIPSQAVDILMGTLSKSLNSCGGYIAGNAYLIDYLRYNCPGFVYSVGITPANAAAALQSLRLCRDNPDWMDELRNISEALRQGFVSRGLNVGLSADTAIVPLLIGDSHKSREMAHRLYDQGINVDPITYPAVKETEARLRFFVSRLHTPDEISRTVDAVEAVIA